MIYGSAHLRGYSVVELLDEAANRIRRVLFAETTIPVISSREGLVHALLETGSVPNTLARFGVDPNTNPLLVKALEVALGGGHLT
jgi:hypothetical protein